MPLIELSDPDLCRLMLALSLWRGAEEAKIRETPNEAKHRDLMELSRIACYLEDVCLNSDKPVPLHPAVTIQPRRWAGWYK